MTAPAEARVELDPMAHIQTLNAHVSALTEEVLLLRTHVAVLRSQLDRDAELLAAPESAPDSEVLNVSAE